MYWPVLLHKPSDRDRNIGTRDVTAAAKRRGSGGERGEDALFDSTKVSKCQTERMRRERIDNTCYGQSVVSCYIFVRFL